MSTFGAQAVGIANIAMDGTVLDTWYPSPLLSNHFDLPTGTIRLAAHELTQKMLSLVRIDEDRMVEQVAVRTTIQDLSAPPVDAHDMYLRLHLLSHRMVRPHEINIEGGLDLLSTVVWTNKGPCLAQNFEDVRMALRSRGLIHVYGIDKLPRMVDYVVPSDIQITEAERVRLGAYLAPGTEVLREGYVSYNSGTLGAGRIEGRLYPGAVIDEGFNLGISSSIVSDKDRSLVRIGKHCHIGVGSAIVGIDLGDNVRIGSNLILEPSTMVHHFENENLVPASAIAGISNVEITHVADQVEPVVRPLR
ncbi:DapH/DapD/GlmU-related protein [Corynebacterium gerontici]|uniref:2,3,4,5-tetrahydropyridine-2,6-dicarboxylate N-succinyltransferase n=1 Tax=Corynebacterium gerontici TaxID=2079234 RepID=A0A3G6J533_9CORY|nr:DapH/DapD/GlmU-related protein [Corynebacterium gerontici]AZA11154.1 2,3,4,5-tetrahydropyridine-2,6-dicarboxylate N-succinyltransferase [Corynebacterium gerontici]